MQFCFIYFFAFYKWNCIFYLFCVYGYSPVHMRPHCWKSEFRITRTKTLLSMHQSTRGYNYFKLRSHCIELPYTSSVKVRCIPSLLKINHRTTKLNMAFTQYQQSSRCYTVWALSLFPSAIFDSDDSGHDQHYVFLWAHHRDDRLWSTGSTLLTTLPLWWMQEWTEHGVFGFHLLTAVLSRLLI